MQRGRGAKLTQVDQARKMGAIRVLFRLLGRAAEGSNARVARACLLALLNLSTSGVCQEEICKRGLSLLVNIRNDKAGFHLEHKEEIGRLANNIFFNISKNSKNMTMVYKVELNEKARLLRDKKKAKVEEAKRKKEREMRVVRALSPRWRRHSDNSDGPCDPKSTVEKVGKTMQESLTAGDSIDHGSQVGPRSLKPESRTSKRSQGTFLWSYEPGYNKDVKTNEIKDDFDLWLVDLAREECVPGPHEANRMRKRQLEENPKDCKDKEEEVRKDGGGERENWGREGGREGRTRYMQHIRLQS